MTTRTWTTTLMLALTASLALAGCGRKGAPIAPSVAARQAAQEAGQPAPEPKSPDRPFVLDGLLD